MNKPSIIKVNTNIKSFTGFYNSLWDHIIDDDIESRCEYGDLAYEDIEIDYNATRKNISIEYVEAFNEISRPGSLGITVKFESLHSPKFYNFETDRIFVDVEFDASDLGELKAYFDKHLDDQYFIDRFTSRDGFFSFVSNDKQVWLDEYSDPESENFCFFISELLNIDAPNEIDIYGEINSHGSLIEYLN